jgi:sugar lactone lactonase YvrE
MPDLIIPLGGLHRFDGNKPRILFKGGITIPNSISWSPDSKTMYFTHSNIRTIYAYDYSPEDGSVSGERVFYQHDGSGEPDGHRIDADGNMWTAVYGESRVLKLSPEGNLIGVVKLPTRNITCPQFVGTELFITSAADEDGDEQSKEYGGGVFRVDVGATGLEPNVFKLGA